MNIQTKHSSYHIIDSDHDRVGRWMESRGFGPYRDGIKCIGLTRNGELVAATSYECCNGASILAHISIAGPITRKWLWFIFAYPFLQLDCKVILGLIAGPNYQAQQLVKHMGFTLVADIPHAHPSGLLRIFAMHRSQCRFIGERYGRHI